MTFQTLSVSCGSCWLTHDTRAAPLLRAAFFIFRLCDMCATASEYRSSGTRGGDFSSRRRRQMLLAALDDGGQGVAARAGLEGAGASLRLLAEAALAEHLL